MTFNIVEYDEFRAKLDEVKDACNFIPDVTTDDGYNKSKRVSLDVGKLITAIEKTRKEKKSYFLEGGREVDKQAKSIVSELEAFQLPHKEAYKELDNLKKEREAQRKADLERRVEYIRTLADNLAESHSSEIMNAMNAMQSEECEGFQEYTEHALKARNQARKDLSALYQKTLKAEQDAAELEKLRKLAEEKAQQEREENIKREAAAKAEAEKEAAIKREHEAKERELAAEQAKIEAEKRAIEAEKQAKIDAEQAEIRAKEQANKAAEAARIAEQERQEVEAKRLAEEEAKREANKRHVGSVRKSAKEALMAHCGLSEDQAKAVVLAIGGGAIPAVSIRY